MKIILTIVLFNIVTCDETISETYDYIVVGAGSAGCIVAARLSEDPNVSVLLLEAGGEPPEASKSPGLSFLQFLSEHDWKYFTDTQRNTKLGEYWPRGKMLGGTGSMNAALFLRANRRDFDYWVNEGCPNWSWDDNLPYYKKVENYSGIDADFTIHGTGGPINVTTVGMNDETINLFVETAIKNGLKFRDPNDGQQSGVYYMPVNILNGTRQSSYTNYLKPAIESRNNLKIETFAFVERILFDDTNTATAILFSKFGKQYKIKVGKELIICGGTINTPQLLMLSGIGPKEHLQRFGIKVIADLPVGYNLADDFVVFNLHTPEIPALGDPSYLLLANAFFNSNYANSSDTLMLLFRDWFTTLTTASEPGYFVLGNSFFNSRFANDSYPDVQFGMIRDWFITFSFVYLLRPESRGRILLKSTDPRIQPEIDFQYFSVKEDLDVHSDGLRKAAKILRDIKFKETVAPQCLLHSPDMSDAYWRCCVTSVGHSGMHPVGTCKMGPLSSKQSVVDCNLKVIGVNKLRVVDASVFPRPLSAPPQATVFMIAEKAADLIKREN